MPDLQTDGIEHLLELHRAHQARAPAGQRLLNRFTRALSRPTAVSITILMVAAWICGNLWAARSHWRPWDTIPFPELGLALGVIAVVIALLILSTQRHDEELAARRADLTLQIALLSERKVAKIIDLLEEQRHDNPLLKSRVDPELEELRKPADASAALDSIEAAARVHAKEH